MGKIRTLWNIFATTVWVVFSGLRTSQGSPLLWSLFNRDILRVPPHLPPSPRDDTGQVKNLRRGRPPKDKSGSQKMWAQLWGVPWLTGLSFSICKMWLLEQPPLGGLAALTCYESFYFPWSFPNNTPKVASPMLSRSHFHFLLFTALITPRNYLVFYLFSVSNVLSAPCEQGLVSLRDSVTLVPKTVLGT